ISTNAAGAKSLDAHDLASWLRSEFNLLATTDGTPPGSAAAVQKAVDALSFAPMVTPLHNVIDQAHWVGRSDWPGNA
ncbi:MAG TPA: hypothetical protein PLV68_07475, partial [Ilumatobacteraceae bacterium]|nr:hypothetical protein [Ilumatobacteraceae bacterium]